MILLSVAGLILGWNISSFMFAINIQEKILAVCSLNIGILLLILHVIIFYTD